MKKIFILLLVPVHIMILLASCSKDNLPGNKKDKDYNWIKTTSEIQYNEDGITEASKEITTYDDAGRPNGYKYYVQGELIFEDVDYSYSGRECTFTEKFYSPFETDFKCKTVYLDDHFILPLSEIIYGDNDIKEILKNVYTYDSKGRRTGQTGYYYGIVSDEAVNFSYNGKECTYMERQYESGEVSDEMKWEIIYLDDTWIKTTSEKISSGPDFDASEKTLTSYDSEGREIGEKNYNGSKLAYEKTDYIYNGKECNYTQKNYDDGKLKSSFKCKKVYY